MTAKIIILDFGSQYTQLIARRLRELNVYCEIHPFSKKIELDESIKGVVLSGSPFSVKDANALQIDLNQFLGKVPVLGICYGAQYIAQKLGGDVVRSDHREYGKATLRINGQKDLLLKDLDHDTQVWMSHGDTIKKLPQDFEIIAHTASIPVAAYRSVDDAYDHPIYCIQFHPEVTHTLQGKTLLKNFVSEICRCPCDWTPASYVEQSIEDLKNKIGNDAVVHLLVETDCSEVSESFSAVAGGVGVSVGVVVGVGVAVEAHGCVEVSGVGVSAAEGRVGWCIPPTLHEYVAGLGVGVLGLVAELAF